jgi:hypothetical protein
MFGFDYFKSKRMSPRPVRGRLSQLGVSGLGFWLMFAAIPGGSNAGAQQTADARSSVAVLDEPGLPHVGGTPSLQPFKALQTLRDAGIPADALSAADLADPARLHPSRFPILVLWNGNAFPQNALKNIRAYHSAGGCLVLNGVSFTHPCEFFEGKWRDLWHREAFDHSESGVGTGGFSGGKTAAEYEVPENPLGVTAEMLPRKHQSPQWFNARALDSADSVTPLVTIRSADGQSHPAAVLISHQCASFSGARDVWIGQVASGNEESDRRFSQQLLVRGVLWALREKQKLPPVPGSADSGPASDSWKAWMSRMDRIAQETRPRPIPENVPYRETPRPWGETFVPKSKVPRRKLVAVSFNKLNPAERIAVACLQGLTCRVDPHIWLLRQSMDREWLDWHQTLGWIDGYELQSDWKAIVQQSKASGLLRGAVLADPGLFRGDQIAINVAACEDALVTSPELARELELPVLVDLRGRFPTYAGALRWFMEAYAGRYNLHLADYCAPRRIREATWAYAYQWRAPLVWGSGPEDERNPGADRFEDRRVIAELFARMSPNSPLMGFPAAEPGQGLGEPPGVELASRYGRSLVCSDFLANTGITSGFVMEHLSQKPPPPAPVLQKDKIYVALALSDGDNMNAWLKFFQQYFQHPAFGSFPFAFGMGPALRELMPAVARWYFDKATPLNEFICDVSGVGYMQPPKFGLNLSEPERAWKGFLDWSARMLPTLEMRTLRPVEAGKEDLERYARAMPFCHSIFSDMGRYSGHSGLSQLTFRLEQGMPVFRAATTWRKNVGGPLAEIREQVGLARPAFVNGFVHCWTFTPADVAQIVAEAGEEFVFVTPAQLAELYRQAERGDGAF